MAKKWRDAAVQKESMPMGKGSIRRMGMSQPDHQEPDADDMRDDPRDKNKRKKFITNLNTPMEY